MQHIFYGTQYAIAKSLTILSKMNVEGKQFIIYIFFRLCFCGMLPRLQVISCNPNNRRTGLSKLVEMTWKKTNLTTCLIPTLVDDSSKKIDVNT